MPATASSSAPTSAPTLARRRDQILEEACARRARLTLTHRTQDGWRLHTGSFHEGACGADVIQIVLTCVQVDRLETLCAGREVGLTFRRGHKKCVCHTVIERHLMDDGGLRLELRRPEHIQELQRRVFERTPPPADRPIEVEFWPADAASDAGPTRDLIRGQLVDISVGGARVRAPLNAPLATGRVYRCRLGIPAARESLTLDAVLRHAEAPTDGAASLGLQFIGLEASREGYERMLELARFVKYLQRQASRRSS